MTYCHWASDNYNCDVEISPNKEGYFIRVKGVRIVGQVPYVPRMGTVPNREWSKAITDRDRFLLSAPTEVINLPFAGKTVQCPSLVEVLSIVTELVSFGYKIPAYVIENIQDDIRKEDEQDD